MIKHQPAIRWLILSLFFLICPIQSFAASSSVWDIAVTGTWYTCDGLYYNTGLKVEDDYIYESPEGNRVIWNPSEPRWEIINPIGGVYYYAPCLNPTCDMWEQGPIGNEHVPHTIWINYEFQDGDGDGVIDKLDECPNTPLNSSVSDNGCTTQSICDTNNDGKTGIEEAISALQITAGINTIDLIFRVSINPVEPWYDNDAGLWVHLWNNIIENPNPFPVELAAYGEVKDCLSHKDACPFFGAALIDIFEEHGTWIHTNIVPAHGEVWSVEKVEYQEQPASDEERQFIIWYKDRYGNDKFTVSEIIILKRFQN